MDPATESSAKLPSKPTPTSSVFSFLVSSRIVTLASGVFGIWVVWKFRDTLVFRPINATWSSFQQSLLEHESKKRKAESYYEKVCVTSNTAITQSVKSLEQKLSDIFPVPTARDLKAYKDDQSKKLAAWETFKIYSFARTLTGLYSLCLLSILRRLQYPLLSRYVYLDFLRSSTHLQGEGEVDEDKERERNIVTGSVQNSFLGLEHFFGAFLKSLAHSIEVSVIAILEAIPLQKQFTALELSDLLFSLRNHIETKSLSFTSISSPSSPGSVLHVFDSLLPTTLILPLEQKESSTTETTTSFTENEQKKKSTEIEKKEQVQKHQLLDSLLSETRLIVGRPEFVQLFKEVFRPAFDLFTQRILHSVQSKRGTSVNPTCENKVPFAQIFPIINKEFSAFFENLSSLEDLILQEKRSSEIHRSTGSRVTEESDQDVEKSYLSVILGSRAIEKFSLETFLSEKVAL